MKESGSIRNLPLYYQEYIIFKPEKKKFFEEKLIFYSAYPSPSFECWFFACRFLDPATDNKTYNYTQDKYDTDQIYSTPCIGRVRRSKRRNPISLCYWFTMYAYRHSIIASCVVPRKMERSRDHQVSYETFGLDEIFSIHVWVTIFQSRWGKGGSILLWGWWRVSPKPVGVEGSLFQG